MKRNINSHLDLFESVMRPRIEQQLISQEKPEVIATIDDYVNKEIINEQAEVEEIFTAYENNLILF